MPHRSPTAADIGRPDFVEVAFNGDDWGPATLRCIELWESEQRYLVWISNLGSREVTHCRVPYSCPDPIAELSMAADKLIELGAPEAARVLMERIALLQQMHKMTDMAETATFTEYQSAYNQMRRQIMESLSIPKSLLTPNPEPQP